MVSTSSLEEVKRTTTSEMVMCPTTRAQWLDSVGTWQEGANRTLWRKGPHVWNTCSFSALGRVSPNTFHLRVLLSPILLFNTEWLCCTEPLITFVRTTICLWQSLGSKDQWSVKSCWKSPQQRRVCVNLPWAEEDYLWRLMVIPISKKLVIAQRCEAELKSTQMIYGWGTLCRKPVISLIEVGGEKVTPKSSNPSKTCRDCGGKLFAEIQGQTVLQFLFVYEACTYVTGFYLFNFY